MVRRCGSGLVPPGFPALARPPVCPSVAGTGRSGVGFGSGSRPLEGSPAPSRRAAGASPAVSCSVPPPNHGKTDMETMRRRSSCSDQRASSLSPLRDGGGGGVRRDKGVACFTPQRLHKVGTPVVGCPLLRGPSPTSQRCFPRPSHRVVFGCSERGLNEGGSILLLFSYYWCFFFFFSCRVTLVARGLKDLG